MSKPTFRPIAIRCNKKQFISIRDILLKEGIRISHLIDWDTNDYLINNYNGESRVVTNVDESCAKYYNRTIFEEWNKDIFLEYCGIQVLPEKWAIKACDEVGHWLNENSDMSIANRAYDYSSIKHWNYFVYPSFAGKSHMFDSIPESYTEITIKQFREITKITKTNKPMSQKLTVPISEVLEIHKIACVTWKPIIGKYLSRVDSEQMITFTQEEVDGMFLAATEDQTPVLLRIFGKKVQIDYDKIKTGSKVMLTRSGQYVAGNKDVDFTKPFDVVFFKSSWVMNGEGIFAGWKMYESYCTFHQDGKYVVFASHVNLDYILSVIEY